MKVAALGSAVLGVCMFYAAHILFTAQMQFREKVHCYMLGTQSCSHHI